MPRGVMVEDAVSEVVLGPGLAGAEAMREALAGAGFTLHGENPMDPRMGSLTEALLP